MLLQFDLCAFQFNAFVRSDFPADLKVRGAKSLQVLAFSDLDCPIKTLTMWTRHLLPALPYALRRNQCGVREFWIRSFVKRTDTVSRRGGNLAFEDRMNIASQREPGALHLRGVASEPASCFFRRRGRYLA